MSQFEFDSAAAFSRLESENLSGSSVGLLVSKVTAIGGVVADLVGMPGAASIADLCSKLMELAPAKDQSNLLYFANSVVEDFRRLYLFTDDIRRIVDENLRTKEAGEVLANATLYVPRTNVEVRLQRLAHIFANGVAASDLDPENTDDMMRAAVELKEIDVTLLRKIYDSQISLVTRQMRSPGTAPSGWHGEIQQVWGDFVNRGGLNPQEHLNYRSSLSRLASFGLIQQVDITNTYGVGLDIYALLVEGKTFANGFGKLGAERAFFNPSLSDIDENCEFRHT